MQRWAEVGRGGAGIFLWRWAPMWAPSSHAQAQLERIADRLVVMPGFGAVRFKGPFCRTAHQTTGPVRNMCRTAHCTDPHRCGAVRKGSVRGAPGSNLLSRCGHRYPDVKSRRASFKPPN